MSPAEVRFANLVAALMLLAIIGLCARKRLQMWWAFSALLVANLAGNLLTTTWPERFWVWDFWAGKQVIYSGLYLAMAVEFSLKIFSERLPRARLRALMLACVMTAATAGAIGVAADGSPLTALGAVLPTLRAGAAWLMALLLVLAVYYEIPVHPFHKLVLVGTALYHCVFVSLVGIQGLLGPQLRSTFNAFEPLVYATTVGLWAYAAWRPEPVSALSPATATLLQPWAAR